MPMFITVQVNECDGIPSLLLEVEMKAGFQKFESRTSDSRFAGDCAITGKITNLEWK